jgi:acyl-CoA thioesterase-1
VLALLTLVLTAASPGSVAAEGKSLTILAFGDSLVAGFGLGSRDGFTAKLEAALKAKGIAARVVNAGLSGDTTAGALARLDWALEPRPDFAIVELGGNDGLRGLDPAQTRANLDAILTKLKAKGVPVLFTGMYAPPNMGPDYGKAYNAIFPALAKKHGVAFYPFFLEGVAADASLNQADGIHPNAKGVDIIVARILPHVLKLIGKE